jgi:glycosyltransferase involved in cell wall biosynthesis
MKTVFAATNPCHMYGMALELHRLGVLAAYHSGYPGWKLRPSAGFPLRTHSFRTLVTYGAARLPHRIRPCLEKLYRWQDEGFDAATAASLTPADCVHGLPGQCREIFRAARRLGMGTVVNHASGPVRHQIAVLEEEWRRSGRRGKPVHRFDDRYFEREEEEYASADYHCCASNRVARQLEEVGVDRSRIWVVPYGADPDIFYPGPDRSGRGGFKMVFAGQLVPRKGVKTLLEALEICGDRLDWSLDAYGPVSAEGQRDWQGYRGRIPIRHYGPVSQRRLADIFRQADLLVLPSWEEGFGLVVPQALACGCPCLVSDRVGSADLIRPGENGAVFPVGQSGELARMMEEWAVSPRRVVGDYSWRQPARLLVAHMESAWT